jgi:hypothetical protein
MKCDSHASFLARAFASPSFGREPKVRVVTKSSNEVYYSIIEKKDKFFSPKFHTLQKHFSCCKAIVATLMLSMNGLTTKMHPITRTKEFT